MFVVNFIIFLKSYIIVFNDYLFMFYIFIYYIMFKKGFFMLRHVAAGLFRFWTGSGITASAGNRMLGVAAERIRRPVPALGIGRNAVGGPREVQVLVRAAIEGPEDRVDVGENEALMIDEGQVLGSGSDRASTVNEGQVLDLESAIEIGAAHLFSGNDFLSKPSVDEIDPSERHVGGFETIQVRTSQCLTRNVNTDTLAVPSQHLDLSVDVVRLLPEWCHDFDCLRQFFFRDLPVWCASAIGRIQKCKNDLSQTRDPCLMRKQKPLIRALQDLKEIEKQKEKIQELLESLNRELLFASLGDFFEKFEKVKLQIAEILS